MLLSEEGSLWKFSCTTIGKDKQEIVVLAGSHNQFIPYCPLYSTAPIPFCEVPFFFFLYDVIRTHGVMSYIYIYVSVSMLENKYWIGNSWTQLIKLGHLWFKLGLDKIVLDFDLGLKVDVWESGSNGLDPRLFWFGFVASAKQIQGPRRAFMSFFTLDLIQIKFYLAFYV